MKRLTKNKPTPNSMFPYKLIDDGANTELDAIHKLGKLEDIEEELGCPIEIIFKAIKNGIYVYDDLKRLYKIEPEYLNISLGKCLDDIFVVLQELYFEDLDCVMDTTGVRFGSNDYKKTWWLKEDKSE